jgi:hypothetical protein
MADFFVTYIGHISKEGQANGLPPEIKAFQLLENVTKKSELVRAIEAQGTAFIMSNGMAVSKDPAQIRDPKTLDANRMFVYADWIVWIDTDIKKITNTPQEIAANEDESGKTQESQQ